LKSVLLDLIYPRRCPICEKILAPKDRYVHKKCRMELIFVHQPCCMRCGKPLEGREHEYCYDCSNRSFHYIKGYPCMKYDARMSHSIASFKYKGKKEYADFYANEILISYREMLIQQKFDVILPIPIHSSRRRERGYNQAELIADRIGDKIGVPVDYKLLVRNRKTLPQKQLDEKERLRNLEQAFQLNLTKNIDLYHKVLLVDDIYTTGSTIEACAKLLVGAGVREVYYTAVCIGQGF